MRRIKRTLVRCSSTRRAQARYMRWTGLCRFFPNHSREGDENEAVHFDAGCGRVRRRERDGDRAGQERRQGQGRQEGREEVVQEIGQEVREEIRDGQEVTRCKEIKERQGLPAFSLDALRYR